MLFKLSKRSLHLLNTVRFQRLGLKQLSKTGTQGDPWTQLRTLTTPYRIPQEASRRYLRTTETQGQWAQPLTTCTSIRRPRAKTIQIISQVDRVFHTNKTTIMHRSESPTLLTVEALLTASPWKMRLLLARWRSPETALSPDMQVRIAQIIMSDELCVQNICLTLSNLYISN